MHSLLEHPPNPRRRTEPRMFGDSVQSSPVNTVGRQQGGSLASLYQARKANDSATVEQIKQQFQKQIEQMMQASQRHESVAARSSLAPRLEPPPQFSQAQAGPRLKPPPVVTASAAAAPQQQPAARVSVGRLQHGGEAANIERGKSFQEARSAVQRQIEKMFVDSKEKDDFSPVKTTAGIKHASHGVSHVTPEEEDTYNPPPPVHYGVDQALKSLGSGSPSSSHVSSRVSHVSPAGDRGSPHRTLERPAAKTLTFDTSALTSAADRHNNNNNSSSSSSSGGVNINIGNIDITGRRREVTGTKNPGDRAKRASLHEDGARRGREEASLARRVSVHQDKFETVVTSRGPPSIPLPPAPASLPAAAASSRSGVTSQSETEYEPISVPPSHASSSHPASASSLRKSPARSAASSGGRSVKITVKHRIEYLGAVPLGNKATNLQALQLPLKELYFKNKALKSLGHSNLPGTLEILGEGMKIQYIRELHKGVQEIFNSFPTIAVWAAVKFVHKNIILPSNERRHRFAFCPLISDPDSEEKARTFYDLDYEELSLALDAPHPPIFACVMRRAGTPKQLECHGFICQSSEDAIIIAANLYQSLLDTMRKNKAASGGKKADHPPDSADRQLPRQELTRRSIRKSVRRGDPPIRPPRRKRSHAPGQAEEQGGHPGLVRRKSIRSSTRSVRSNRGTRPRPHPAQVPRAELITRQSTRRSTRSTLRSDLSRHSTRKSTRSRPGGPGRPSPAPRYNGDLFTKVSIGRTKSFVGGNQYNLQELFRELKEKEGVDSIDDVLRRVISPDGMSFNDIKPVYRELLLKLAMTMSQDEIFQRSKTIMANTKKKKKRPQQPPSSNSGSLGSFFKSFSKSPSKTHSMSSSKKSTLSNSTLTSSGISVSEKSPHKHKSNKGPGLTKADISGPIILSPEPRLGKASTTSKEDLVDDAYMSCSECGTATTYESVCTYEDCTYNTRSRGSTATRGSAPREAGHVSECDTDSCISEEKCYCSLRGDPRHRAHHDTEAGHTTDTSACYSSCSGRGLHTTTSSLASSRQNLSGCESPQTAWRRNMGLGSASSSVPDHQVRGSSSARSPSVTSCGCSLYSDTGTATSRMSTSMSGTLRRRESRASPGSGYTSNTDSYASQTQWLHVNNARNEIRDGRGSSGASSCSSSSHKSASSVRSSSSPRSPASPSQVSQVTIQNNRSQNSKILLVSAVDPRGNVMYKGSAAQQQPRQRPLVQTAAKDQENIMSLKKSAEIAALFSGARINQTTDLVDPDSDFSELTDTHHHRSVSHKLGYFP